MASAGVTITERVVAGLVVVYTNIAHTHETNTAFVAQHEEIGRSPSPFPACRENFRVNGTVPVLRISIIIEHEGNLSPDSSRIPYYTLQPQVSRVVKDLRYPSFANT